MLRRQADNSSFFSCSIVTILSMVQLDNGVEIGTWEQLPAPDDWHFHTNYENSTLTGDISHYAPNFQSFYIKMLLIKAHWVLVWPDLNFCTKHLWSSNIISVTYHHLHCPTSLWKTDIFLKPLDCTIVTVLQSIPNHL